jgi:Aldose 1-epimerase
MKQFWFAAAAAWLAITSPAEAAITVKAWGGLGGKGVDLFTLTNANGMQASITNYGAIITAIRVPGRAAH